MLTVDTLRAWGANVDEGLGRCMNMADFYLRMVRMELEDKNFDRLDRAVAARDAKETFDAAHALKGAVGNVSLTPIYEPICEICDQLRGQTEYSDVSALNARVNAALDALRRLAE